MGSVEGNAGREQGTMERNVAEKGDKYLGGEEKFHSRPDCEFLSLLLAFAILRC